jgi:ribosomal protein S18 acetylase RimI-like enzyme
MALHARHPLDNPIWCALTTSQAKFAETSDLARKFPAEMTTLAGFLEPTRESYDSLTSLVGTVEAAALFLESSPAPPAGWRVVEVVPLLQMVQERCTTVTSTVEAEELNAADVSQMQVLAELTKPGPFGRRTHELGTYLGVRCEGRLVAMAGERLRVPGYTEISAVCTHPEHLGRGYASALAAALMRRIRDCGEVPFLHVRAENKRAVELYERLGFTGRAMFHLAVLYRE